jgi:hypothetical protein
VSHPAALTDDYSYHLAKTVGAGLGRRAMVRAVLTAPDWVCPYCRDGARRHGAGHVVPK